jgi:integrase
MNSLIASNRPWQHGLSPDELGYPTNAPKTSVFYNHEAGKPFVDLSAGFARACRMAGITGVTWHTLRHTFASRLLDRRVDIIMVKELLGHSTVS